MANIPFTNNYVDLSSNRGFQFKFHCQKCGNGYLSTFQTNALSTVSTAAQVMSSLFGGLLGRAAQSAQTIEQAVAGPQHDSALRRAVEEIAPTFKQCSRCGSWVCEPVCWNKLAQLCENCAPDLDEEISSAQAQAAKVQAMEKAREVNYLGERDLAQRVPIVCPTCGARTQGGKFCPECGGAVSQRKQCAHCGAQADGTPKFCPECGKPYGG
jgi:hypothetical protein